jgi:transposase
MKDSITYVGLDTHKKQHSVAMLLPDSDDPIVWTIQSDASATRRMVRKVTRQAPGPVLVGYECGVCGFALHRQITALGVRCMLIAPSLVPLKPGNRIKTDRRDAKKLVFLLRAGLLTEVHPPTEQQEALRDLCRGREATKRDQTGIRHQITKFLLRQGVVYCQGRHWTQRHVAWLRTLRFKASWHSLVFADYLAELVHRDERLATLDRLMQAAAQEAPHAKAVGWLRCFHGIDTVTALTLVAELYGIERFGSPRQLMSYLGLTPSEHSSGDRERKGGITKAGNGRVRRMLIQTAWHYPKSATAGTVLQSRRKDQPPEVIAIAKRAHKRLHMRYWSLVARGKLPVVAATAVARELAGFLWAVLYPPAVTGPRPCPVDGSLEVRPVAELMQGERRSLESSLGAQEMGRTS